MKVTCYCCIGDDDLNDSWLLLVILRPYTLTRNQEGMYPRTIRTAQANIVRGDSQKFTVVWITSLVPRVRNT